MTLDDEDALVERLLRAGRGDGPSARALRAAPLAISALLSSAAAQAAAVSAGPVALSPLLLVKWVGVGTLAGASLMGLAHAPELLGPEPVAVIAAPAPAASPATSTAPPASPPPSVTVVTPSPSESSGPVPARPDVAREILLLDRARRELLAGDATGALRALSMLERLPGRALVPEATLLRVRALLRQGKKDEARRVAEAFCALAPGSPQAKVLRALVDTEIQSTPPRL